MRTRTPIFLIMFLAITIFSTNALPLEVKEFPQNPDTLFNARDAQNPYLVPFTGLFTQTIKVGTEERSFKTYIPARMEDQAWSLFVVLPSGESAASFLETSGWKAIADKGRFYIFMAEAKGAWNLTNAAAEIQYLTAVVATTQKRVYYTPYPSGMVYLVGYKDGATIAQMAAMAAPTTWSGLATFGTLAVDYGYLASTAKKPSVEKGISLDKVPLPAWIIADTIGAPEQAVIDYWKSANAVLPQPTASPFGTVYAPSLITTKNLADSQPVSKVIVTTKNTSTYDPALNEELWYGFLAKNSRFVSIGNGQIRAMATDEDVGMQHRETTIDGVKRTWEEWIPPKAQTDPSYRMPLVIVLHGGGNAAKAYLNYLQWYKVGEERGVMIALPQAYPTRSRTSIGSPNWNTAGASTSPNDTTFIREMIKDIATRNNIDTGRIYVTGMSLGSFMAVNLAMTLSDVITACGSNSGVILQGAKSPLMSLPYLIKDRDIPLFIIGGDTDVGGKTYEQNPDLAFTIQYFQKQNSTGGFDQALRYRNGIYSHLVYQNAQGVPMVRYALVEGKGHATMPSETWILWDEFFCKYSRDATGAILYMGKPVR